MGCCHKRHRFTISLLLLFITTFSNLRLFNVEGRKLLPQQTVANAKNLNDQKAILRAQIGSRPPRCERRCSSCQHCEAIQVPTNPSVKNGIKGSNTTVFDIAYARNDDTSNYKPMSWKCKCGNLIYNP